MHPKYGNNVSLLKFIGIKEESFRPFGLYHCNYISYSGEFKNPIEIKTIDSKLKEIALDKVYSFPFGKKFIRTVGVVSGGGSFAGAECKNKDIDLFITGETSHELYNYAKDSQLSIIFASHYATEIFGVMNLGKLINEKFGISFTFIDFKPIF
jgi:putative NIF3 family GTP cyclohydrolase 1 type 2